MNFDLELRPLTSKLGHNDMRKHPADFGFTELLELRVEQRRQTDRQWHCKGCF